MGHFDILAKFFAMFPNFLETVKAWSPIKEHNAINVELCDGRNLLFTYWNDREWELTSVNNAVRQI